MGINNQDITGQFVSVTGAGRLILRCLGKGKLAVSNCLLTVASQFAVSLMFISSGRVLRTNRSFSKSRHSQQPSVNASHWLNGNYLMLFNFFIFHF